jgi:hypothetical protein
MEKRGGMCSVLSNLLSMRVVNCGPAMCLKAGGGDSRSVRVTCRCGRGQHCSRPDGRHEPGDN